MEGAIRAAASTEAASGETSDHLAGERASDRSARHRARDTRDVRAPALAGRALLNGAWRHAPGRSRLERSRAALDSSSGRGSDQTRACVSSRTEAPSSSVPSTSRSRHSRRSRSGARRASTSDRGAWRWTRPRPKPTNNDSRDPRAALDRATPGDRRALRGSRSGPEVLRRPLHRVRVMSIVREVSDDESVRSPRCSTTRRGHRGDDRGSRRLSRAGRRARRLAHGRAADVGNRSDRPSIASARARAGSADDQARRPDRQHRVERRGTRTSPGLHARKGAPARRLTGRPGAARARAFGHCPARRLQHGLVQEALRRG